ncbi:MAG: hypothetical protein IJX44_02845 [Bacteroidaceae bacterium]|nr:hypothetical protein [Bacteroidaceae bacterium]
MNTHQIRNILNIVFIIGAIASVITYYTVDDRLIFIYVSAASIFVKGIEYIVRFLL